MLFSGNTQGFPCRRELPESELLERPVILDMTFCGTYFPGSMLPSIERFETVAANGGFTWPVVLVARKINVTLVV